MKKKLKSITEKERKTLMLQLIAEMSEEKISKFHLCSILLSN